MLTESRNVPFESVKKALADLHTALPGRIVEYNDKTMTATVELGIKRRYRDREAQLYPLIDDVPVVLPVFNNSQLRPPASDLLGPCLVVFTERSLDEWLNGSGEPVEPNDARRFSISDAVALPGLAPDRMRSPRKTPSETLEISRGGSWLAFKESGGIEIKKDARELFSLLQDLCQFLIDSKVNTGIGPQPLDPGTIEKLMSLKTDFKEMTS